MITPDSYNVSDGRQILHGVQVSDIGPLGPLVVFRADREKRWPHWPLIGWHIFEFSSATTGRNFMKLQNLVSTELPLPRLCFWAPIGKPRWPSWQLIAETFSTSFLQPLKGFQWKYTGSKYWTSSTKFVYFGANQKTKMTLLASDFAETFSTSPRQPLDGI